ncbi:MAG: carboxymuconolactone decarboxylase family protein [Desulfurococcales archaeon]|nr:carboxymuconolactone decarboxylase family protein [Desulfurococcales archaeon]
MLKERLKEFSESLEEWGKTSPKQVKAFMDLVHVVEGPGALDTKTKELISIALSIAAHCEWCIAFHVKNALDAGATPEEIREASWVAVLMGGGPSLAYMQLVEKALKEYKE